MALPKALLATLRDRRSRMRLAADADTQHGVLMLIEQRVPPSILAEFFGFDGGHFNTLVVAARAGSTERVPAWRGEKWQDGQTPAELAKARHAARVRARKRQLQ